MPQQDIILGAKQFKDHNPIGTTPRWDTDQGNGEPYGAPATRMPNGVKLGPLPLVTAPVKLDMNRPAASQVIPAKGLSGVKRFTGNAALTEN